MGAGSRGLFGNTDYSHNGLVVQGALQMYLLTYIHLFTSTVTRGALCHRLQTDIRKQYSTVTKYKMSKKYKNLPFWFKKHRKRVINGGM